MELSLGTQSQEPTRDPCLSPFESDVMLRMVCSLQLQDSTDWGPREPLFQNPIGGDSGAAASLWLLLCGLVLLVP